jgi:hypothetical protein
MVICTAIGYSVEYRRPECPVNGRAESFSQAVLGIAAAVWGEKLHWGT